MDKIKKTIPYFIILILTVVSIIFITKSCNRNDSLPRTVYITDTVTNIEVDTCYLMEIRTEKLHTTDTLYVYRDSIYQVVDSVNVEVPISTYVVDKVFENDSSELKLHLSLTGYNVKLDTIAYTIKYTYTPVVMVKKNFFKDHFRAGIGISGGYGIINKKADIYVGAGFYFVF